MKVDILLDRLNPRIRAFLGLLSSLVGIIVCLVLIVYGSKVVWSMLLTWESDPKSQIGMPKGPLMAIIPLCSLPLLIQFVRRGLDYHREWKSREQPE